MSNLINRKAAISLIESKSRKWPDYDVSDVLKDLADMPAMQPEQKTARWQNEEDPYGYFAAGIPVCSNCGQTNTLRTEYPYCPWCGAKMESALNE